MNLCGLRKILRNCWDAIGAFGAAYIASEYPPTVPVPLFKGPGEGPRWERPPKAEQGQQSPRQE